MSQLTCSPEPAEAIHCARELMMMLRPMMNMFAAALPILLLVHFTCSNGRPAGQPTIQLNRKGSQRPAGVVISAASNKCLGRNLECSGAQLDSQLSSAAAPNISGCRLLIRFAAHLQSGSNCSDGHFACASPAQYIHSSSGRRPEPAT